MSALKITAENTQAIESALKAANGKASAHAFTSFDDVLCVSEQAEKSLEKLGVPASKRAGAKFYALSGEKVANSYDYRRAGTALNLIRKTAGWYLVSAKSVQLFSNQGGKRSLSVTAAQDEHIIKHTRSQYSVQAKA